MIKRFVITLISALCCVLPASANIKVSPDTVDVAIKEAFKQEKDRSSALATYTENLDANGTISAEGVYKVCAAGGLNIKDKTDKSKCVKFKNALIKGATISFKEVCGKDKGKTGGKEYCITDFSGEDVTMSPAVVLSREWVRIKHNDPSVQCSNKFRTSDRQDFVKCVSRDKNVYYEFEFDNVEESNDETILDDTFHGACKYIFGGEPIGKCYETKDRKYWLDNCYKECKGIASKTCNSTFAETMNKFGYSTYYYQTGRACLSDTRPVLKKSALKTAYGIDNFVFCRGIQMQNVPAVDDALKRYIIDQAKNQGTTLTASQIKCGAGAKTYTGHGCKVNGVTDFKDDIKTCTVGNKQIDFVFDDINEAWKKYHKAGLEGMACIVEGGNYAGKSCLGLSEEKCEKIKQSMSAECPECKLISWDPELEQCVLPSSASAENLKKGIQIATIAGATAAGIVITVATGGTAGAGGVLLVVEVTGAAIELDQQYKIQHIADEFFVKSNKCKEPACAEDLVKQYLQRLSNIYNDLTDTEAPAIDQEMARLFELIPETSAVYNGSKLSENQLSMFDSNSWEPEQVWRAIGVGLQLTGLATGLFKWLVKPKTMQKTTVIITTKLQKALPAAKEMKALGAHADDGVKILTHADDGVKAIEAGKMTRADAKALQDIAAREAKLGKGKSLSKTDIYKRNEIYNKYRAAMGDNANIEMAGKAVMKQETIAETEAKLAKAQESLRYAKEHPGNISKAELRSRELAVQNLEKELSDLGVTYTKVADDVVDASRSAGKAASGAEETARTMGKATDEANDAVRAAGNTARAAGGRTVNELDDLYRIGQKATTREEILAKWGLRADATDAEIAARYRQLSKRFHPDMHANDGLGKQVEGIFADIAEENRLLGSLPRNNSAVKGAISGTKAEMKALPSAAGKVVAGADDIPMIGHNLIGAMAAGRALERVIGTNHPDGSYNPGGNGVIDGGDNQGGVIINPDGNGQNSHDGGSATGGVIGGNNNGDLNNNSSNGNAPQNNNGGSNNNSLNGNAPQNNNDLSFGGNNNVGTTPYNNNGYNNGKPTTFTPDKQKNVGLIVGLTAAGLVATGAIVGGVIAATTKDKAAKTAEAVTVNQLDPQLEQAMNNANGILGTVDGKQVSLMPLPTTVNTNAKIVDIDAKAVTVVNYNGYKLPFFINKNNKWTPILGIGEKGHWFNVYPNANSGIKTIDNITKLLNQQVNPSVIVRYIGNNASGVALPSAANTAFGIINAEFPNGVLQSENMTPQDAKLYSQNYDLIKNKLE